MMKTVNAPIVPEGEINIMSKKDEAFYNINKMEAEFFVSFGLTTNPIQAELKKVVSGHSFTMEEESHFPKVTSLPKHKELESEAVETEEEMIEEEEEDDWICTCEHSKNVKISMLYTKDDPFDEVGDIRRNIWEVRRRQYESKFGPRLRDELKRTVLPDPIKIEMNTGVNEDNIWLSDIDKQLLRFIHKPPLTRLRNLHGGGRGTADEREAEEAIISERIEYAVIASMRKADKVFTAVMKEYAKEIRAAEFKKYTKRLVMELNTISSKFAQIVRENQLKLRFELSNEYNNKVKGLNSSMACELDKAMKLKEEEMRKLYGYLTECSIWENLEKSQYKMRQLGKSCIEWMKKLQEKQNHELSHLQQLAEMTFNSRILDMEGHQKLIYKKELKVIEMRNRTTQKRLLALLINALCDLEESNKNNAMLLRKNNIGITLVKELIREFQKFVVFALKEHPQQGQFLLSFERLFQMQLDESMKGRPEDSDEDIDIILNKIETALKAKPKYPVFLTRKCSSDFDSMSLDHSDVDFNQYKRNMAKDIVTEALRNAIPSGLDSATDIRDPYGTRNYDVIESSDDEKAFKEQIKREINANMDIDTMDQEPYEIALSTTSTAYTANPVIETSQLGCYISALDIILENRQKQKAAKCQLTEALKEVPRKTIRDPLGKSRRSVLRSSPKITEVSSEPLPPSIRQLGESFSDMNVENLEEFKVKRIKGIIKILRNHPDLMKATIVNL